MAKSHKRPILDLWDIEKAILAPPEDISISEWANKNIVLLKTTSREPGPYRWQRFPFQRDIQNLYKDPRIHHLVLKWATQIGKTLVLYNILAYVIDQDPYSTLLIYPSDETGRTVSRTRIQPMIEASKTLRDKKSSDIRQYQLDEMAFPGMILYIVGAHSPTPLKQKPCRNVFRDEINDWPPTIKDHGDPLDLSEERFKSFYDLRKIVDVSSPTVEDGNITRQEARCQVIIKYYVPCPFCHRLQTLEWENIIYEDHEEMERPDRLYFAKSSAFYECKFCKKPIDDTYQEWMLDPANGAGWFDIRIEEPQPIEDPIALLFTQFEARGIQLGSVASRLSSIYSPWLKWGDIVNAYMEAKLSIAKRFDNLRKFKKDWLAVEWKDVIEPKSEDDVLLHRCDLPPLIVPKEALALTAGIDVHKRHIEYIIRAWARDYTSWLIRYGSVITWEDLEKVIFDDVYQVEDTQDEFIKVWRAAIDTAGSEGGEEDKTSTEEVYTWLRNHGRGVVYGIKGASRAMPVRVKQSVIESMSIGNRKRVQIPGGLIIFIIDTAEFKELVLQYRMGIDLGTSQAFYVHAETGKDYAKQLAAEEKQRDPQGRIIWTKTYKHNHYLDCEIYAAACADPHWQGGLRVLKDRPTPPEKTPAPKSAPKSTWLPHKGDGWLGRR